MSIYQKASLVQIPSGYKAADDKLYSVVPSNGDGDFTIDSDADATRVNKDGLIETTVADQARLNYDPINPQDPHLLLEPTRTNAFPYSENFSQWTLTSGITVTGSQFNELTGNTDAYKIETDGASGFQQISETISATSGNNTYSVFAKKGTVNKVTLRGTSGVDFRVGYDLNTGTIDSELNVVSSKIEQHKNDWYRLSVTFSGADTVFYIYPSTIGSTADAGNVYVWGAQLEAGSYPTSYIPTSGSAVTRTADNCKIDSGLAAYIGNPSGTFFVDVEFDRIGTSSSYGRFVLSDQTSNINRIIIDNFNGNIRAAVVYSGGSISVGNVSQVSETRYKLAFSYKSGDNTFCINGTNYNNTGTYTLTADMESIKFSDYGGTNNKFQGKLHQLMVFNTALTDAELITLTT